MSIQIDQPVFNKFLQFARKQTDSNAIARADPLGQREITVAQGDKVRPIGKRSADAKQANDRTREMFAVAVAEMFGGAKKIPRSVLDVMKTEDYFQGKPLTARRILKVSRAIMEATEPMAARVSLKKARGLVDTAVAWMNDLSPKMIGMQRFDPLNLDAAARDKAARLVVKHGAGLTASSLGVLAGYAATAVDASRFRLYDDEEIDEIVRRLAETLKNVRTFRPGDIRLATFDAKMTKYWQALLKEHLGPTQTGHFDADGMFDAFRTDGRRNEYKIGDEVFPEGSEKLDRLTQTFKDTIANPLHRKALSGFMTQMTGGAGATLSIRDPLPPVPGYKNVKMTSTKGHDLFLTVPRNDDFFQRRSLQGNWESTYELKLSEDGTKATVTLRATARLKFGIDGAEAFSTVPTGTCVWQTEFDFDLSRPDRVGLTAVRHGQTIVPPSDPPPPEEQPGEERMIRIDE
jgi:hypothetical protein